jgi:lipopolysaccharide/colanic/teichoic acid biosynthesis glycosyltransferase
VKETYADAPDLAYGRREAAHDKSAVLPTGIRRGIDIGLSVLLLVLLAPLYIAVCLAILIDSGRPVHFRQARVGRRGRQFRVYKFRTMRREADPRRHRRYVESLIQRGGEPPPPGDKGLFKLVVDDRITGVGRILRLWSLDELPQLWNVLRGQMSLVGPRPVIPYEVELYPDRYMERFAVKPGITGLWQVTGRSERTYEEMVDDDIDYVRRESVRLYLRILIKTPWVILARKGAA